MEQERAPCIWSVASTHAACFETRCLKCWRCLKQACFKQLLFERNFFKQLLFEKDFFKRSKSEKLFSNNLLIENCSFNDFV